MRHILLPRPIATGTQGMSDAAAVARLVAPSGRALPLAPRQSGTAASTIDLAAIAAAADEHLSTATGTQKETGWRCVRAFGRVGPRTWTKSATSEICPRIRALHGGGHGADVRLAGLDRRGACLPDPTGSYRVCHRRVSAPIRRHSWRRRAAMDWLAWRGRPAGRQSPARAQIPAASSPDPIERAAVLGPVKAKPCGWPRRRGQP